MRRVEWELWTSTNDGCGSSCDRQATFKIQMRDAAVELQKVLLIPDPCDLFPAPVRASTAAAELSEAVVFVCIQSLHVHTGGR